MTFLFFNICISAFWIVNLQRNSWKWSGAKHHSSNPLDSLPSSFCKHPYLSLLINYSIEIQYGYVKKKSAQLSFFNSLDLLLIGGGVIHCFVLEYYECPIKLLMMSPLLSSPLYIQVIFSCSYNRKFHLNWTSFKTSPVV